MIPYPHIDPVAIRLGPISIRWYGIMYLLGFTATYLLVRKQLREQAGPLGLSQEELAKQNIYLDDLILYGAIGVILGGRLGYVLFYNLPYYMHNPIQIFETWHGGMSFHGGLTGAVIACALYCRKHKLDPWKWGDMIAVTAPIGLGLGRIGNFINGELYGRPTNVPWAMIFPNGGPIPRHPSQLYEAFLEGVLLFVILWPLRNKNWPTGRKVALFLMLYGIVRIFAEFFREPDPQLGFILWGWVTMGQILSLAVFIVGVIVWMMRSDAPLLYPEKQQ